MSFRLRSFVRRGGRGTKAQARAQDRFWPYFGLSVEAGLLHYGHTFGRNAPCYLEIGFGGGESLRAIAKAAPDKDFIGVETHKPGIGLLLLAMQEETLPNLRIYDADVIDVLEKCIPNDSLAGIQLFFPDPWPKRRHHPRRLIQPDFVRQLSSKLQIEGTLHLATDWEDYAQHMLKVLSAEVTLENLAGSHLFSQRSFFRPLVTKFEHRAIQEGRPIRELQFKKVKPIDNLNVLP